MSKAKNNMKPSKDMKPSYKPGWPWADIFRGHDSNVSPIGVPSSIEDISKSLGDRLRFFRREKSRKALGDAAGMTEDRIEDIEKGNGRGMTAPELLRLSKALSIHPAYLLGVIDHEEARMLIAYESGGDDTRHQIADTVAGIARMSPTYRLRLSEVQAIWGQGEDSTASDR